MGIEEGIVISLFGIILILIITKGIILSTHSFQCRTCDYIFKANFLTVLFTTSIRKDFIMKCPKRKKRDLYLG